jgi:CPA2 family monovalent cation:H+ antiporter-2
MHVRLHSVLIAPGSAAVGKTLEELDLSRFNVEVTAIRQRNIRNQFPDPQTTVQDTDVIVLRGVQESLALAEMFLLQGDKKRTRSS